jgi:hypothetical protein
MFHKTKRFLATQKNRRLVAGKTKYFCIGRNKTGTTSLNQAFLDLGFKVGDQREAELLYDRFYFQGNFAPVITYCERAQAFQDVPFSCPETYKHLDKAYPGSKFILTVRNDAEQWYQSITRFHSKMFGKNGLLPTSDDLRNATYVRPGFMFNTVRLHNTPEADPYNKAIMTAHYESHNNAVRDYFAGRPDDLLVLNLSDPNAYKAFIKFLNVESPHDNFPWENKT